MPTQWEYRESLAHRFGGYLKGTVSLGPEPLDPYAQRSILSASLYDAERSSKAYAGNFAWNGRYRDQRRVRENGYSTLSYAVYNQPVGVGYTITFYGHGVATIPANATAIQVQNAITAAGSGLVYVTVTGTGTPFVLKLPDVIDITLSAGEIISGGGIGALQVNRGFTKPLQLGDVFELHTKLPVEDADSFQGLNTIINMALKRLWFIDRFPITPGTNSAGISTFFGLTDYPWLTHKGQIIAVYDPIPTMLSATLTPPGSGTYTLTLDLGPRQVVTAPLAFGANSATILSALQAAAPDQIFLVSGGAGVYYITLASTYYATPRFVTSAGSITNTRTVLEGAGRSGYSPSYAYDAEAPFLQNYGGSAGMSFYVEGYRPAHTWVSPQASYGVIGTEWQASSTGLLNDYDRAVPDVEDVATVAYHLGCLQLASAGPANDIKHWQAEANRAAYAAAAVKMYDLPFEDKPRGNRMGSRGMGWGSKGYWGRW